MAEFIDTASIFQLAFGVNAVLPAVYFAFRRTHESIASRFASELKKIDGEFKFDESEMIEFRRFVYLSSAGLRATDRIKFVPLFLFAGAVAFSFVGLMLAATNPHGSLSNTLVWVFSVYALLISPTIGLLYELWLHQFERLVILSWLEPANVEFTAKCFRLSLDARRATVEARTVLEEIKRKRLNDKMQEMKDRWRERWRTLRRVISFGRLGQH